jgi:hypothetical protein
MSNTRYVYAAAHNAIELDYEPKDHIGTLDWFNIARCARERMSARCGNIHEWRGERRSFYTAIQLMDADSKYLLD